MTKEPQNTTPLSILDRLILLQLIPKEGNMVKLMMFDDIVGKIELSNTETKTIELKATDEGHLTWNQEKAKTKDVELSSAEKEFIKGVLVKMDSEEKLTKDHKGLYNLFVK